MKYVDMKRFEKRRRDVRWHVGLLDIPTQLSPSSPVKSGWTPLGNVGECKDLTTQSTASMSENHADIMYGAAWMQSAVASRVAEDGDNIDPCQKLSTYLDSPLEPFRSLFDSAVIAWWKDHAVMYPTLAKMA
jgi:hypothetical protein